MSLTFVIEVSHFCALTIHILYLFSIFSMIYRNSFYNLSINPVDFRFRKDLLVVQYTSLVFM